MRVGSLLCLGFLASLLQPSAGAAENVTWQDAMGRNVTLSLPASRIVSLAPSVTEILYAIGAEESIAGVSKHCDYPIAAKLKTKAGDFNSPDLEKVRELSPDLVLFAEYVRADDLKALEQMGVDSFVLPASTIGDITETTRRLGEITGRVEQARTLADELEGKIESIREEFGALPTEKRPDIYVEVDGPARLYAVGPGSFMDEVVRLAGGKNVFAARKEAYFAVDPGEVVRADPEVILIDHPFQYKVGVSKRSGWEKIAAVRNGRVYDGTDFDIILFNRPGPRIVQSLEEISRLLHPELSRER